MPSAEERRAKAGGSRSERSVADMINARRGLTSLLEQEGANRELVDAAELIESVPGGPELLYSYAVEQVMKKAGAPDKETKKVRLYEMTGDEKPTKKAKGGLAQAAQKTRSGGRGGDSMLLHMTPEEFEIIKTMWGEPDINPDTGLPEYGFFSKIWKKVKKAVKKVFSSKLFQILAPIALNIFAPGLGAAIGGKLLGGLGSTLVQKAVGNALVRGTMSSLGGGDFATGAIQGAVSGGLGQIAGEQVSKLAPGLSDQTAALVGSSLAGGAGAELTGGDFAQGAITGGLAQMMQPTMQGITERGQEIFGVEEVPGQILAGRAAQPGDMSPVTQPTAAETLGLETPAGPAPEMSPIDPELAPEDPFAGAVAAPVTTGGAEAAATTTPATTPAAGGGLGDLAMPLMLAGMAGGGGEYEEGMPPTPPESFETRLPVYLSERQFIGPTDPSAYYQYGVAGAPQTAEQLFITPAPFAGEAGTPTAPTGGLEAAGTPMGQGIQGMIQTGQMVPAAMAQGNEQMLQGAGYTQGQDGNFYPPGQQPLGAGTGFAMGGGMSAGHEQRFGQGGSPVSRANYYQQNADVPAAIPTVSREGGHHVRGPGTGRSDDIPARLSDGEYVIDAETVALLGDGSGDAGARRLDEMRRNLRKHKATNLKKGEFTHKAKSPESYMPRLRAAAGRG